MFGAHFRLPNTGVSGSLSAKRLPTTNANMVSMKGCQSPMMITRYNISNKGRAAQPPLLATGGGQGGDNGEPDMDTVLLKSNRYPS